MENLESRITFDASLATVQISSDVRIWDTFLDNAGNSYQTGLYAGRVDFDPAVERPDGSDILDNQLSTLWSALTIDSRSFVAKYNADGSFAWVRSLQAISEAITVDANGNVFAGGRFFETSSIANQTLTSLGSSDAFYAKYSANGAPLWARREGTALFESIHELATDSSGAVIARMRSSDLASSESQSIIKTSSGGTVQWRRQFDNVVSAWNGGLAVDSTGSIVFAGTFRNTVDFDPGPKRRLISSVGNQSGFILKLTNAGALSWVSTFTGAVDTSTYTIGTSNVTRMDLDPSNNIVLFGTYTGRVDFDPGSGVKNLPSTDRYFVAKFNSSGRMTWAQSIPLPNSGVSLNTGALSTGPDGSIYLSGNVDVFNPPIYTPTWVDLNPGPGVSQHLISTINAYVIKLNPDGSFVWSEVLEHTTGESGITELEIGSKIDPQTGKRINTIHLVGSLSQTTVDLDPSDTFERLETADMVSKRFVAVWNDPS